MSSHPKRAVRPSVWLSLSVIFVTLFSVFFSPFISSTQAAAFADPAFSSVWGRSDQAIADGSVKASWMWGPEPRASRTEAYRQSPGGQRLVQYFDKSRMEINNPNGDRNSQWFVTNGLLCRELVSGQIQVGDGNNEIENRAPANVPVGGDLDSPVGPTYATFNGIASLRADKRAPQKGGFVTESINREGQISNNTDYGSRARYTYYDNNLGHNIPDVFVNWMNGLASRGGSWQYVLGLPITEPYWATFKVGGQQKEVLVQLFERRALTFNPQNDPVWQVEMGNIGLHYWAWRYGGGMPANAAPAAPTLDGEEMAFLNMINQYRQANGKPALSLNQELVNAAKWMSQDMASHNYMAHNDSQGRDPFVRMAQFGYNYNTWKGENVAAGYETAQKVMVGWQNSPHHNENMLNDNFHTIGIARAYNPNSTYKWYWTTDFGGQ